MTGFGEAGAEVDGIVYTIQIRTVNNRHIKTILRLPDIASFAEEGVEKLIRQKVYRGTVNYTLRMQNVSAKALFDLDEHALRGYIKKLQDVARTSGLEYKINPAELLTLPGVVCPITPDDQQAAKIKETILDLTSRAIKQLLEMRSREGESLAADLTANCEQVKEKLQLIGQRAPVMIQLYRDKIQSRLEELLVDGQLNIDQDTLARETAIFADRCDIAEELTRLQSHLEQFVRCCEGMENGGRRLDFISQEMLREANTIASKASDVQISQWVIDIKCSIDRIKEQVQNVE